MRSYNRRYRQLEWDDPKLIEAAVAGDATAADILFSRYDGYAWKVATHYTQTRDAAEEAVAAGRASAFEKMSQLRDRNRFGPWLATMVRNSAYNEHRRNARTVPSGELPDIPFLDDDEGAATDIERFDRARKALLTLPERHRRAIDLAVFDELPVKEVAAALMIDVNTAYQLLYRARRNLRRAYISTRPPRNAGAACRACTAKTLDYLAGNVDVRAEVDAHVATCLACRTHLAEALDDAREMKPLFGLAPVGLVVGWRELARRHPRIIARPRFALAAAHAPVVTTVCVVAGLALATGVTSLVLSDQHTAALVERASTPGGAPGTTPSRSSSPTSPNHSSPNHSSPNHSLPNQGLPNQAPMISTPGSGSIAPASTTSPSTTSAPAVNSGPGHPTLVSAAEVGPGGDGSTIPAGTTTTTTAAAQNPLSPTGPPLPSAATTTPTTVAPAVTAPPLGSRPLISVPAQGGSGQALTTLPGGVTFPTTTTTTTPPGPPGVLLTGNGNTLDTGGIGANATWSGAASYAQPNSGGVSAFSFNGSNGLRDSAIPALGTSDFTVSFDIDTTQVPTGGGIDVLGSRASCSLSNFFDVRLTVPGQGPNTGYMLVELDQAAQATDLSSSIQVATGTWHRVQITRVGVKVTLTVDGAIAGTGTLPVGASLTDGTAWQVGNGDACIGQPPVGDGTVALDGSMANIYVGPTASAPAAALPA